MTISPKYRPRLIVMVKEPRAGRVKTRLGRDLGMTTAAWWFRHQTARLLREVQDTRWQTVLAVSPDRAMASRAWPAHVPRTPQGRGDLGARMGRLFRHPCKGPMIIIGADIPAVRRGHIARAFDELGRNRAVFGPATDGGYWLIGLDRKSPPPPDFFADVRWSTRHALADTLATLPGPRVAYVETLPDIDTAADLAALNA